MRSIRMVVATNMDVEAIARNFVESMSSAGLGSVNTAGNMVLFTVTIWSYQLTGIWEQLALAEQRFKEKHPKQYLKMRRFHRSSIVYGFIETQFDNLVELAEKIEKDLN